MMLKALGLEITPEHIAMLQALIPQLPAKINEAAQAINAALANFDARLRAIEAQLDALGREQFLSSQKMQTVYQEVLNAFGNTARISDTSGPGTGTGRRGSRARTANGGDGNGSAGEPGNTGG